MAVSKVVITSGASSGFSVLRSPAAKALTTMVKACRAPCMKRATSKLGSRARSAARPVSAAGSVTPGVVGVAGSRVVGRGLRLGEVLRLAADTAAQHRVELKQHHCGDRGQDDEFDDLHR